MAHLYEIAEQYKELAAMADDESLAEAVRDTMQGVVGEFEDKGKAIACVLLNMDGDVEAIDAQIARLNDRKKAIINRQESMKDYLRENMEACGIKKITHPLFSITCVQGREIAVIDQESILPDEMVTVKTVVSPDKSAIAKALKEGLEVPGAHLERAKSSIRIK